MHSCWVGLGSSKSVKIIIIITCIILTRADFGGSDQIRMEAIESDYQECSAWNEPVFMRVSWILQKRYDNGKMLSWRLGSIQLKVTFLARL